MSALGKDGLVLRMRGEALSGSEGGCGGWEWHGAEVRQWHWAGGGAGLRQSPSGASLYDWQVTSRVRVEWIW